MTPWALVEPDRIPEKDSMIRDSLFGEAELTILYSGNMGRAHDFNLFFKLARSCCEKNAKIVFCFACRGYHYSALVNSIKEEDINIRTAGFASPEELEKRLSCADIHMVSLCEDWSGIVVPSKFFGSIAVGKPILYAGPTDSAIANWIKEFNIGWNINSDNIDKIADELSTFAKNKNQITEYLEKTFAVYNNNFSRKKITENWHLMLDKL